MKESTREKLLKVALVAFGAIFFLIYPLGLIWPELLPIFGDGLKDQAAAVWA